MLIAAASFAVSFVAAAAGAAVALPPVNAIPHPMPSMVVQVQAAPDIPSRLVAALLEETQVIWRENGVQFLWERASLESEPRASLVSGPSYGLDRAGQPGVRTPLRVFIGHETSVTGNRVTSSTPGLALGWIVFDDPVTPEPEIYVSYANACALLARSGGVVGPLESMPPLKHDTMLARAMGRALAHEFGHYLSASKAHAPKGLMMAVHSAAELFGTSHGDFKLGPIEQRQLIARLTSIYIASRG